MAVSTRSPVLTTSTLNKFIKQEFKAAYRKSPLLAAMKANGRIKYNQGGSNIEWRPTIRRQSIVAADPYNPGISFPSVNEEIICKVGYSTYNLGTKIVKFDRLANQGSQEQWYNLVGRRIKKTLEDFMEDLPSKFYVDGGASESKELGGFQTVNGTTGLVPGGYVGNPSDTYAGQSTALDAFGGTWTGVWPNGSGSYEYGAWSPLVVDYNNPLWMTADGATSQSWKQSWRRCLNFATTYLARNLKYEPDFVILDGELLRQAEDSFIGSERFLLDAKSKTADAGVKVRTFDGREFIVDYHAPSGMGIMSSWDQITLYSMQSELVAYEKDHVIETSEDLHAFDCYAALVFHMPRNIAFFQALSDGS